MADLAESPEQTIVARNAAVELDAKLAAVAQRNRERVDARRAAGQPATVSELVAEQTSAWKHQMAAAIANPPERLLRLTPDEGDAPDIPPSFRAGMVPARFASVTLDDYQPATRHQRRALDATRYWLVRAKAGEGCMLALVGPQGTGKSHLLYAAANALLDHGTRLYARPWYRLADELRYGGQHPVTREELEADAVRRTLWKQKILLLDEVRPTAGTAFDDMELTKLACHCYDSRYPMFITSNVNPFADVMGGPAASRFTLVDIDGPDRRQA